MDFVVCSLRNFSCSDYSGPLEIKTNRGILFYILFQEGELLNVINSYRYLENFGLVESNRLLHNFVCFQVNESVTDSVKRGVMANNFYILAQIFSISLWFIKDNAVTPYFATVSSDSPIDPNGLRRNVYYSNSRGIYELTSYSTAEIEAAMKWLQVLESYSHKIESTTVEKASSGITNMSSYLPLDSSSFHRAIAYLDTARKTDFLPSKISNYITILELLFSVRGDNTHKVAERTATFIGKNNDDRVKLFKEITSAYDIRSSYVHGSEIKDKKRELLPETSETLDSIVRQVMSEMITNHPELNYKNKKDKNNPNSKDADAVNEWFNHFVLNRE